MLLQSHAGEVHLLPALPKAWPRGSVRGLRARGGFVVDISWEDGKIASYRIEATRPATLRLRVAERVIEREMKAGDIFRG
jgi:alpha-L-fucosidase 2